MGIFRNLFGKSSENVKGTFSIKGETHKVEARVNSSNASIEVNGTVESGGKKEPFNASFTKVSKEKEAPVRQAGFSEEVFVNKKKLQSYFN